MKNKFFTLISTLLLASTVQAATIVETYDEGKDKVGEDGFVVVVYPSGWNAKNEALGRAILNSSELDKAAGNAVMMGMGLPNTSTKEMTDGRARKAGAIKLPAGTGATLCYPCIYLCEADGRNYALINANEFRDPSKSGAEFTQTAVAKAAKLVAARQAALKKQRKIMAQLEGASGKQALDLIHQACTIQGINRPDKFQDLVKKHDPNGESGLLEALTHNTYAYIEGCGNANAEQWQEKIADIDRKLQNPYFSVKDKQTLCTSAFGMMRRHAGSDQREKMFGYLETMKKLDPKSIYGRSYVGAMRLWDVWSCDWSPDVIPATNGPMEIATPTIKDAGIYTVSFNYKSGKHAFLASGVELYDGNTKVAEDNHDCFAGSRHNGNVYTLSVKKKVSKPRLIINTKMGNNRDSRGVINIKKE